MQNDDDKLKPGVDKPTRRQYLVGLVIIILLSLGTCWRLRERFTRPPYGEPPLREVPATRGDAVGTRDPLQYAGTPVPGTEIGILAPGMRGRSWKVGRRQSASRHSWRQYASPSTRY